ncbi:MAG: orotidine-5'-phosphate decarboxylase [Gammaproteobacteria bacterium]|jgi:orotidine-5'-phosphate decarboxylase
MNNNDSRIIVALDYADQTQALEFVAKTSAEQCKLKIGKELFTRAGPQLVEILVNKGFDVFLDLKFHDIPNTVKKAVYVAAQLGVWMVNVHAMGGQSMLAAAREGIDMSGNRHPFLVAVSVLTSMSKNDLVQLGINDDVPDFVQRLAGMALKEGLDGLVCSAQEATLLRDTFGTVPLLVTPGIRPSWASKDDQQRIMTPELAVASGASYLVIGRPITQHKNPAEALSSINQSISNKTI